MASTVLHYDLVDWIAYRVDTRNPEVIFREGFWNKQTPDYRWPQIFNQQDEIKGVRVKPGAMHNVTESMMADVIVPPLQQTESKYQVEFKGHPGSHMGISLRGKGGAPVTGGQLRARIWEEYARNEPAYRDKAYEAKTGKVAQHDISPETAVCLSLRPDVTPYFPLDGTPGGGTVGEWVWLYAVRLSAAITTFRLQRRDRPEIAFAKEVAVEHVPYTHVLCAVHCWRIGKYPDVQFNLAPRIWWNTHASNFERARSMHDILRAFFPYQGYRSQCPTSGRPSRHCLRVRELLIEGYPMANSARRGDLTDPRATPSSASPAPAPSGGC